MRVNISMNEDILRKLDDVAKSMGMSRSALITLFCLVGMKSYFSTQSLFDEQNEKK